MKKLLVVTGPTAVGKSDVSILLAKELGGEIISADSMQVYKGLDIGTAKISSQEMQGVKHHLIDILDPKQSFSTADFRTRADEALKTVNGVPVICGGTGLYLNSLLYQYDFPAQSLERTIEIDTVDAQTLYHRLQQLDPIAAQEIHPNNKKRVARAIEMAEGGGLKSQKKRHTDLPARYPHTLIVLSSSRENLYDRINKRVDLMMEQGLFEEVKILYEKGLRLTHQSMQAIGYKQLIEVIEGKATLFDAVQKIKQLSRNYAKRQITWFKKMKAAIWLEVDKYDRHSIVEMVKNEYKID